MHDLEVEDWYRAVVSSIDDGFCVIEVLLDDGGHPADYRFLEVNPAFERQTGLINALGKRMLELAPDHERYWFEIYGQVALTGEPARFTNEAKALGGRWFEVQAFRVGPAERRQVGILFTDISENRRTADVLQRNQTIFYHLIQNNPFGVYVVDADFKLRQVSLGAQKVFSSVRPLLGRDFAEVLRIIWPEPFASEAIGRFQFTLATGIPYTSPGVVERRQDISQVESYDWRIERVTLPDGRFGVVCYFYDLSERMQWEAALRSSEERLRLAISIAQMGTFQIDLLTDAVEVNDPGRHIYGWAPDQVLTFATVQKHFHPDDAADVMQQVGAAMDPSGAGEFELEQRIIRTDRSIRWIRVRGRAVFEESEGGRRPVRCIGTYIDVSEQRYLRERIEKLLEAERAARAEAEEASEAKSNFLAALSHELRTPLTPVLLTIGLIESRPDLPAQLREDIASIRRNVELESQLISDLLDLTRISKGKLELDEQVLDLHEVVQSAMNICKADAAAKLTLDFAASRHNVRGDATRLQQVFWNLINNAIKFTPAEGTVTIRSSDAGDRVRIEIIDTGVGIDATVLPKLFTAFEQGEARSVRQHAGLGLGLAISKRLTEAHSGTIGVISAGRGKGATFFVELPTVETLALRPSDKRTAPPAPCFAAQRILLIEDHEPTLIVMSRLLRALGHQVEGVSSVGTAIAVSKERPFDLIISDLGLPDGSGLDVMRSLGAQFAGRAIALTGYGMDSDIEASRQAGFAEHLTKPVELSTLKAAINRLCRPGS